MKISMNARQGHIFVIKMQFVAIPWGATLVAAKKMATGMVTDLTATITIHVGTGQVSMNPSANESATFNNGPWTLLKSMH